MTDPRPTEQDTDAQAQQHPEGNHPESDHPEGNVPGHIDSPEVGLPVDDGQPSGEQNGEEQEG